MICGDAGMGTFNALCENAGSGKITSLNVLCGDAGMKRFIL